MNVRVGTHGQFCARTFSATRTTTFQAFASERSDPEVEEILPNFVSIGGPVGSLRQAVHPPQGDCLCVSNPSVGLKPSHKTHIDRGLQLLRFLEMQLSLDDFIGNRVAVIALPRL